MAQSCPGPDIGWVNPSAADSAVPGVSGNVQMPRAQRIQGLSRAIGGFAFGPPELATGVLSEMQLANIFASRGST